MVQILDVDRAKPVGRWLVLRTKRYPSTLIDKERDSAAEASRRGLVRDAGRSIASPSTLPHEWPETAGAGAGILTSLLTHVQLVFRKRRDSFDRLRGGQPVQSLSRPPPSLCFR
jgi:hypothetical protein